MTTSQKILLITRNFPPVWGGMERLNWHIADELARHGAVQVIAPAGAASTALPATVTVTEIPLNPVPRCLAAALRHGVSIARAWRPDWVLAGSGLTAPVAWMAARSCGARAAAYVHGLDLAVPHPLYRALWLPALRRMDRVIANSAATARLGHIAGIAPERTGIVHPGVRLPAPDPQARARFRAAHGLGDGPVLLSVGRLTARKGLREFVSDVLPLIAAECPAARLVVVGDAPTNALYSESQTKFDILAAADKVDVGNHLIFLGTIDDANLAAAYLAADVYIFPVRYLPNNPEGFGMVAIEAAAHGLATVAYGTGGVVDAVSEGVSGRLIEPHDGAAFAEAVLRLLAEPLPRAQIQDFAAAFAWERFGERLFAMLSDKP